MESLPKHWFIISFAELEFSELAVESFITYWHEKGDTNVKFMVAYALFPLYRMYSFNHIGIYKHFHGMLTEDGDFYPRDLTSIDIKKEVNAVVQNSNRLIALQEKVRMYLEKLDTSYKSSLKYTDSTLKYINEVINRYSNKISSTNEKEYEEVITELEKCKAKYHEYFADPIPEHFTKYFSFNNGYYIFAPKPFGNMTDDFNSEINKINYGINSIASINRDDTYTFKLGPEIKNFENLVYLELYEFFNLQHKPLKCAWCGDYIEDPSRHQYARARRGHAVLHKPVDLDKIHNRKYNSDRTVINLSECELQYKRKRDNERYLNKPNTNI